MGTDTVKALIRRWVTAEIAGDIETLQTITTPDFTLVGARPRPGQGAVAGPLPRPRPRHHPPPPRRRGRALVPQAASSSERTPSRLDTSSAPPTAPSGPSHRDPGRRRLATRRHPPQPFHRPARP